MGNRLNEEDLPPNLKFTRIGVHFGINVDEKADINAISITAPSRSRIEHIAMYFTAFMASALTPLNLYFTRYIERSMLSVIARL